MIKCRDCRYSKYNIQTTDYLCTIKLPPWVVVYERRINITIGECDVGKKKNRMTNKEMVNTK